MLLAYHAPSHRILRTAVNQRELFDEVIPSPPAISSPPTLALLASLAVLSPPCHPGSSLSARTTREIVASSIATSHPRAKFSAAKLNTSPSGPRQFQDEKRIFILLNLASCF
jgi:hypothetical protein